MSYFVSKIGHLDPVSTVLYTVLYQGSRCRGSRCPTLFPKLDIWTPASTVLYTVQYRGPDVGGLDVGGPDVGGADVPHSSKISILGLVTTLSTVHPKKNSIQCPSIYCTLDLPSYTPRKQDSQKIKVTD